MNPYAARLKAADAAIRKLQVARKSLRAALETAPDDIDMDLARAIDALFVAIHNIEQRRRATLDLIVEIKEWDAAHA